MFRRARCSRQHQRIRLRRSENAPFIFVFITPANPQVVFFIFPMHGSAVKNSPIEPIGSHVPSPGGVVNLEVLLVGVLLRAFS